LVEYDNTGKDKKISGFKKSNVCKIINKNKNTEEKNKSSPWHKNKHIKNDKYKITPIKFKLNGNN